MTGYCTDCGNTACICPVGDDILVNAPLMTTALQAFNDQRQPVLTITNDGHVIPGDGLQMDQVAADFLRACSQHVEGLEQHLAAAVARAERAELSAQAIAENAVSTLMGQCAREDRHGVDGMAFGQFVEAGGGECVLCWRERAERAEARVSDLVRLGQEFWRPVARDLEHNILSIDSVRFLAQDYLMAMATAAERPSGEGEGDA